MAYTFPILNQFGQTTVPGQLDLQSRAGSTITCTVSTSQATPLVPGQAVKLDTSSTDGTPKVLALASDNDTTFGFVIYTIKDQTFPADQAVEIATVDSVMYMNAGAAITRGAAVQVQTSTGDVVTNVAPYKVVGIALDGTTAADQLLRVFITPPAFRSTQGVQTAQVSVTQAQLNAGQVLIPGITGQAITVLDIQATFSGSFATGTAMVVESTNASPVVVDTLVLAGMTGFVRMPDNADTHQTIGAGAGTPLGSGDGLQVVHTGSAFTGGTAINFLISFVQK